MCALRKCALELANLNSTLTHCLRREMWPSLKSPTLHQTVLLKTWKELKSDKCNCFVIVLQIILNWPIKKTKDTLLYKREVIKILQTLIFLKHISSTTLMSVVSFCHICNRVLFYWSVIKVLSVESKKEKAKACHREMWSFNCHFRFLVGIFNTFWAGPVKKAPCSNLLLDIIFQIFRNKG